MTYEENIQKEIARRVSAGQTYDDAIASVEQELTDLLEKDPILKAKLEGENERTDPEAAAGIRGGDDERGAKEVSQIFRGFQSLNSKEKGRARKRMELLLKKHPEGVLQPSVILRQK